MCEDLAVAVLSSSTPLKLSELAYEVRRLHGDVRFDVLVPRHGHTLEPGIPENETATDRMIRSDAVKSITDKLKARCETCEAWERSERPEGRAHLDLPVRIAALATYFPDITCRHPHRRANAANAIRNVLRVGHRLREAGRMKSVCVEIVCGTILDKYSRTVKQHVRNDVTGVDEEREQTDNYVGVHDRRVKFEWLCASLAGVFHDIEAEFPDVAFGVGLEFEPGVYLLNDADAMNTLNEVIDGSGVDKEVLEKHLGFNLDLAHMRIAGVPAARLDNPRFINRIVHAHIADHPPGMHTRDHPLGAWTAYGDDPTFLAFVRLLLKRQRHATANPGGLPFSGTVALELEGCHHLSWVHNSIPAMRRLLARAALDEAHATISTVAPPHSSSGT